VSAAFLFSDRNREPEKLPRKSAAELETTLVCREATGRQVEITPPSSLTTAGQRDVFKKLIFEHPHLTTANPRALANYVLCLVNAARLRSAGDSTEYFEVIRAVRNFEKFLGLPQTMEPPRRKIVATTAEASDTAVDYAVGDDGVYREG
jgi:hypothetical protein